MLDGSELVVLVLVVREHGGMDEEWVTVELRGGPLDGQAAYVCVSDPDPGTALMSDHGVYGMGGRSWYEPDEGGRWVWVGDTP